MIEEIRSQSLVHYNPHSLVKFKNPYSVHEIKLIEAAYSKDFCLSINDQGQFHLKQSQNYYLQIQAAMFYKERHWHDLDVFTTADIHIERIGWEDAQMKLHCTATGALATIAFSRTGPVQESFD